MGERAWWVRSETKDRGKMSVGLALPLSRSISGLPLPPISTSPSFSHLPLFFFFVKYLKSSCHSSHQEQEGEKISFVLPKSGLVYSRPNVLSPVCKASLYSILPILLRQALTIPSFRWCASRRSCPLSQHPWSSRRKRWDRLALAPSHFSCCPPGHPLAHSPHYFLTPCGIVSNAGWDSCPSTTGSGPESPLGRESMIHAEEDSVCLCDIIFISSSLYALNAHFHYEHLQ